MSEFKAGQTVWVRATVNGESQTKSGTDRVHVTVRRLEFNDYVHPLPELTINAADIRPDVPEPREITDADVERLRKQITGWWSREALRILTTAMLDNGWTVIPSEPVVPEPTVPVELTRAQIDLLESRLDFATKVEPAWGGIAAALQAARAAAEGIG